MSCRSISAAAAVALLFVSATASAQVYKCSEGGKTVFSDRPCGEAASRVDVRPSTGSYDPDAAARIRNQTENVNSRFDAEERARDRARQDTAARVEADRQAKIDKCRKIREYRDERIAKRGEQDNDD